MDERESQRQDVARGTWLSERLLLVVDAPSFDPGDTRGEVVAGDKSFEVDVRCISLAGTNGTRKRSLLTAAISDDSGTAYGARPLRIATQPAAGEPRAAEVMLTDLKGILEDRLSGLAPGPASRVLEFISAAPTAHGLGQERDLVLSSRLHALRSALRHRLPTVTIERDQPLTGNVDELVAIDDSSFFVKGWMRDGEAKIASFTAITPEGEHVGLLQRLSRHELPEFEIFSDGPYSEPVDASWFVGRFETRRPSRIRREWVFEIRNETGRGVEMRTLPAVTDIASARAKILGAVPERVLPDEHLMADHLFPAIDRLQEQSRSRAKVDSVADYGDVPALPEVSIVVPLYQRIDLVEHQLLQFDRDPEVRSAELIYVLDSPELHTALAEKAHQMAQLYQVPFRVVTMAENAGFGAANNAGVSVARGELVLLMNSDVLPAGPGWLGTMKAFYEATPDVGALGPKLLYEDDSLQHAGLYFERLHEGPTAGSWANMHYFKGLHRALPAANIARPVPAVTAACMLIEKDLYQQVGGLSDVYVQGDYEDSELCLRLLEAGCENWYLPAVELYHLEGASYTIAERGITGSYNRWLQTRRMGQAIESAMARYPRI